MTSRDIRQKYISFFVSRGHKEIEPAKLVLENDPTTLFTSSGMQPLVPYLLGEKHPEGMRLVNSQPSFRAEDIEEVGDNRHTTAFEMLGNWSLGDYFKKEQLSWIWEFLTEELGLEKEKMYVTVFEGNEFIPKDECSREIWKSLGVPEERIFEYGVSKNWWSKSGTPDKMPVGEIGGPDSEVFYEFESVKHDTLFGEKCHPNCDCGRFSEIANSVFIQYKKTGDGEFEELPQKNVDFGGGLERLAAAVNNDPDIFNTDLYLPVIKLIEKYSGKNYSDEKSKPNIRIIADHLKAATFLIVSGVIPSNKMQGYVLRRLIRRVAVKMHELRGKVNKGEIPTDAFEAACADAVLLIYNGLFGIDEKSQRELVVRIIVEEMEKFGKSLEGGLKFQEKNVNTYKPDNPEDAKQLIVNNVGKLISPSELVSRVGVNDLPNIAAGTVAFNSLATYGFPRELSNEYFQKREWVQTPNIEVQKKTADVLQSIHQGLSRTASAGKFVGGLAGHSEIETKYHTATHLLHQALRDVLGPEVFQKGSNITTERLRFDFSFDRKMTAEEINQVEDLVNKKIAEDLKVERKFMTFEEAKSINAIGLFDEKYDKSNVSIYCIGPDSPIDPGSKDKRERGGYYSLEFCGGPHVENTGTIKGVKITKEEAVSAGIRRIRAELA